MELKTKRETKWGKLFIGKTAGLLYTSIYRNFNAMFSLNQ